MAVFIYSSVLNFDFSMEVLTTKVYYEMSLSAALIFWFWARSFYRKRDLHHERDQSSGPFPTLFLQHVYDFFSFF